MILTLIRAEMWKILIFFATEKGVFKRFRLKIHTHFCFVSIPQSSTIEFKIDSDYLRQLFFPSQRENIFCKLRSTLFMIFYFLSVLSNVFVVNL